MSKTQTSEAMPANITSVSYCPSEIKTGYGSEAESIYIGGEMTVGFIIPEESASCSVTIRTHGVHPAKSISKFLKKHFKIKF